MVRQPTRPPLNPLLIKEGLREVKLKHSGRYKMYGTNEKLASAVKVNFITFTTKKSLDERFLFK